jgi:hypothetical protein
MKYYRYFILLMAIAACIELPAQENEISSTSTSDRAALIIGNSEYTSGPLLNPENDARSMANALRNNGFVVFEHINVETMADMKKAIREFGREIQNGGVGLFYYAGHGIQVNGKNYLIPTKAEIYAEEEVEYEAVDVGFVLAQMEIAQNRMNILILDACRNNPFARSWRSAGSGLAFINAPTGTLIAYSTAPGSVASDGTGSNGLYTEELLKQINNTGLKIEDVFKRVRSGVVNRSQNLQTPWESSSLIGDFYFKRPDQEVLESKADDKTADMLEASGLARWRKEGDEYRFYQSGIELTQETKTCTVDRNALLYDKTNNKNYVLENYWDIKDEELRDAREIISRSNAFWMRHENSEFRFYFEGAELTGEVNNAWFKENLMVYVPDANRYFTLSGFKNAEPFRLFTAEPIFSSNHTLWWAGDGYYYLYVRGKQIAGQTYWQWSANDLIVYDEEGQSSYRFPDYYNNSDQSPRPAEVLVAPGEITWTKNENNTYWLHRNGVDFESLDAGNAYSGNDLLVYEKSTRQDFLLKDYSILENDVQYPAEVLWSKDHAFWLKSDSSYWLYVNGELISARTSAEIQDQDLEVHDPETGTTWVLKDYYNLSSNTLRPAKVKE